MSEVADFITEMRAAFDQFAEACREALRIIAETFAPIIRAVVRWWRQCQHLMPRQYRDTMQRRKLRRAATRGYFTLRR